MTKCIMAVENTYRPTFFCHACGTSQYSVVRIHCDLGGSSHAVAQMCQACIEEAKSSIERIANPEVL